MLGAGSCNPLYLGTCAIHVCQNHTYVSTYIILRMVILWNKLVQQANRQPRRFGFDISTAVSSAFSRQNWLSLLVNVCSDRKKIRSKSSGNKGKKRSGAAGGVPSAGASSKRAKKTSSATGLDKTIAAAAERAPEPPSSSLSNAKLAEVEIKINRSPVMVLWATVSAVHIIMLLL